MLHWPAATKALVLFHGIIFTQTIAIVTKDVTIHRMPISLPEFMQHPNYSTYCLRGGGRRHIPNKHAALVDPLGCRTFSTYSKR